MKESLLSRSNNRSIVFAVGLILIGLSAIVVPFVAGLAVALLIGALCLIAGVVHLAYSWSEVRAGAAIWQILIGTAFVASGLYLFLHPHIGVIAVTFLLALVLGIEGAIEVESSLPLGRSRRKPWLLLNGILSIVLAVLILFHWPTHSWVMLGTLVGVSIFLSGIAGLLDSDRSRRDSGSFGGSDPEVSNEPRTQVQAKSAS
jgi:uncharacterized membrane protein HdeD (DUF308 family)